MHQRTLSSGDDGLARTLARVYLDDIQIEPFPETRVVLERLRARGLRLAVISNAWPSLDRRYQVLGLRHFFDPFIISTQVGASKPAPAIFCRAIDDLGLPPESLLFVDDWPGHVQAAIQFGLQGVVVVRGDQAPPADTPWIGDLGQVDTLAG